MEHTPALDLTAHWAGLAALVAFGAAYLAVMAEEHLGLRKSQPVLVAAGLIWLLVGIAYAQRGETAAAVAAARETLLEYAELFLFLLVAMTYVNTMTERGVFDALRVWLVARGHTLRTLFWVSGLLAFLISPFAPNLTVALVMGAVVVGLGRGHPRFVTLSCINVVVASNAGGAFSPFGDTTTLMVWQRGLVDIFGFLPLLVPALVNWLVPATIFSFWIERDRPPTADERPRLESGALTVVGLFVVTTIVTVAFQQTLGLPAVLGMMAGLGLLKLYSYVHNLGLAALSPDESEPVRKPLDTFAHMEKVEWDTLIFFYGVMMGVGGLGALGYLALTSQALYGGLGATWANVLIGLLSAVVDNVPVMFAVLQMNPAMSHGQWLLVTLTAGVGGSLLSIGSAAGVALMGQARGAYTFLSHLRWAWAIALGYAAGIAAHLALNRALF
jgi:Na+/H+ antiporter NhaD/arsenite permease-like protein